MSEKKTMSASERLRKLLKIESLLIDLDHDDFNYDICWEDTGVIMESSDYDDVNVPYALGYIKLMASAAKLNIELKDLKTPGKGGPQ